MRSSKVAETSPFVEFGFQIDVIFIAKKLIKLLLVGTMGRIVFAIKMRGAPFVVGVPDSEVFDMPMELRLELVAIVCPHLANAEWKLFGDVVNEVERVCLRLFLVDLEGTNSGCIVDSCVL